MFFIKSILKLYFNISKYKLYLNKFLSLYFLFLKTKNKNFFLFFFNSMIIMKKPET
jgi:hypothetical protein